MLRTADLLALPKRALSAGIDAGLTTDTAAQLLGGWTLTETGLSPASRARLIWTHPSHGSLQSVHLPTVTCTRRTPLKVYQAGVVSPFPQALEILVPAPGTTALSPRLGAGNAARHAFANEGIQLCEDAPTRSVVEVLPPPREIASQPLHRVRPVVVE